MSDELLRTVWLRQKKALPRFFCILEVLWWLRKGVPTAGHAAFDSGHALVFGQDCSLPVLI